MNRRNSPWSCLGLFTLTILLAGTLPVRAADNNPYRRRTFVEGGKEIDEIVVPGRPPLIKMQAVRVPQADLAAGVNTLTSVPAFTWSYGCSATSAAMIMGYYDSHGYPNMYTGPANGGVCPLNNETYWGHTSYPSVTCGECPLSATHNGTDGRATRGHVDDYWIDYNNAGPDPYLVNGWTEHTQGDCTADFMGTNQSKYNNVDGGTTFYNYTNGSPLYDYTGGEPGIRDGCHGMKLFANSRGYTVTANFSQYIYGYKGNTLGFTFANYKSEIDAGRPVMIQVAGHSMVGYGYDDTTSTVYIHDTWDNSDHSMTWGGSYSGMQHYGVTVLRLQAVAAPVITQQPQSQAVCAGSTATFAVAATGDSLTYQWQTNSFNVGNGGHFSGVTTTTLTVAPADSGDALNYRCIVNGTGGSATSTVATLTVSALPTPYNVGGGGTYCAGSSGVSVSLDGSQSGVSYSLQLNGSNTGARLAGTGGALSFDSVTAAGTYGILASNTTTRCTQLMSGTVPVTTNPASVGGTATPSVGTLCSGSGTIITLTGQAGTILNWQSSPDNGTWSDIVSTANPYATGNLIATTYFRAVVQNGECPPASSAAAQVTVAPTLTPSVSVGANPGTTICAGSSVTFTATPVNGGSAPSYVWKKNGVVVGGSGNTYAAAALANGDTIDCQLTSNASCVSPATANAPQVVMAVNTGPTVTSSPASQTVAAGTLVNFSAAANGTPAPTVQWQRSTDGGGSWSDLGGATSLTYSFTVAVSDDGQKYRAVFSNVCGTINSAVATLTVRVPLAAPAGLVATAVSASQINLGWADRSSGEVGFLIERAPTVDGPWSRIGLAPASAVAFQNVGLWDNTPYAYRVRAYDALGASDYSNVAGATTAAGTGLLAHWTFDEGQGTTAFDLSGNGNQGVIAQATWTDGAVAGALDFNGVNAVVTVPNAPRLNPTTAITLAAWVGPASWTGSPGLVAKGQYKLFVSNNSLQFQLSGLSKSLLSASLPSTGLWHHVAGTFDGSWLSLYLDGSLVVKQKSGGSIAADTGSLAIGSVPGATDESVFFDGSIDDVRIYGRALTAAQILALANPFVGVTMLAPNGGEHLLAGSVYPIVWGAPAKAVQFTLNYSLNGGKTWSLIATNLAGGTYDWPVPAASGTQRSGLIQVIGFDGTGQQVGMDNSDAAFVLDTVRVVAPNGGESLTPRTTATITWQTFTSLPVASVSLKYSTSNGGKWTAITTLSGNPGTYAWTVPVIRGGSTAVLVQVNLLDASGANLGTDTSDSVFTVTP